MGVSEGEEKKKGSEGYLKKKSVNFPNFMEDINLYNWEA